MGGELWVVVVGVLYGVGGRGRDGVAGCGW